MKSTHDRDSGYDAGVHNADDVSPDNQTCPRCGTRIHAIETRGPSEHVLTPCGCRASALTVRELSTENQLVTDGGHTTDQPAEPDTRDHDSVTGTLPYELGRAEVEHGTSFAAVEALCYQDSPTTTDELRAEDWLLPIYASTGRIVLFADVDGEGVFVAYDGRLTALAPSDVFGEHRELRIGRDDAESLIERASNVTLLPRHQSRFADSADEPELITDGGQHLDSVREAITCLLCGQEAAHCSCCTDDDPDGPSVTATVDGGEIVHEATDADVRAAVTNSEVSA